MAVLQNLPCNILYMVRMREREKLFEQFLKGLNSFWGKLTIIGIMVTAGFTIGCYYQETQMIRKQIELDKQTRDSWFQKEDDYRKQIFDLRNQVIDLKIQLSIISKEKDETKE